jgi:serine/threonine protein kinase
MRPAEMLTGKTLKNDWIVGDIIKPGPQSTGGCFSVGYHVVNNASGIKGYLKALDFSKILHSPDPMRELQSMTTAYNFERDILSKCKGRKMTRVVMPLADGDVDIPSFTDIGKVFYIIFECADGDIRAQVAKSILFDLAWCLRSLHHTAVGLQQLHLSKVAHQDLKPSNVLVFKDNVSKIADLGRAHDATNPSDIDQISCPGDLGYAPFEQHYSRLPPHNFEARRAADMYLFGSIFFFYFSNCSASQAIRTKLLQTSNLTLTNSDFVADMPYIKKAYAEALQDFRADVLPVAKGLTDEIVRMVREFCEPDPAERGDVKKRAQHVSQYSMERYISFLNVLAKRVEVGLRK